MKKSGERLLRTYSLFARPFSAGFTDGSLSRESLDVTISVISQAKCEHRALRKTDFVNRKTLRVRRCPSRAVDHQGKPYEEDP